MTQNRIPYVDFAKGIAIWLMIVGHQQISPKASIYIFSFHMPLFFLLSGMFFKRERDFLTNLKMSIRKLLVPYFAFSIINMSVCWISPRIHPEIYYNMQGISVFIAGVKGMFIGTDYVTPTSFMPHGQLWFLTALFIIRLTCILVGSVFRSDAFFILSTIIISTLLFFVIPNTFYFSTKQAMLAMPFFIFGYLLNKIDVESVRKKSLILAVLFFYFIIVVPFNGRPSIHTPSYGNNMIMFYVNAIVGSIMVILASTYLCRWLSFVELVGRNTLIILGMNRIFLIPQQIICVLLFGNNGMSSLGYIFIVPVLSIMACLGISRPIKRYLPFILGK